MQTIFAYWPMSLGKEVSILKALKLRIILVVLKLMVFIIETIISFS